MSDLISRSALKKEIEGIYLHVSGVRSGKGILAKCMDSYKELVIKMIDEQPTAYNVDAVVAELEEKRKDVRRGMNKFGSTTDLVCMDGALISAIDIVRKCGVE